MANKVENQYLDGTYLANNPSWDRQDCRWKAKLVKQILDEFKVEPKTICDVGCGSGDVLACLKQFNPDREFTGYDISPQAEQFWEEHRVFGIDFHCGDFLIHNEQFFDCILLLDVIEHLPNPFIFLESIQKRAKYFVFHFPLDLSAFTVLREKPLINSRSKVGHIHYFTKGLALAILRDAGFHVVHSRYTNAYLGGGARAALKTRIAALPRLLACSVNKDFGVRLLGGETLIVLAEVANSGR